MKNLLFSLLIFFMLAGLVNADTIFENTAGTVSDDGIALLPGGWISVAFTPNAAGDLDTITVFGYDNEATGLVDIELWTALGGQRQTFIGYLKEDYDLTNWPTGGTVPSAAEFSINVSSAGFSVSNLNEYAIVFDDVSENDGWFPILILTPSGSETSPLYRDSVSIGDGYLAVKATNTSIAVAEYTADGYTFCGDDLYNNSDFLLNEGFEGTGTPTDWSAGSENYDSTAHVFEGTESLTSGSGSINTVYPDVFPESGVTIIEAYYYLDGLPPNSWSFSIDNSLRIDNDGSGNWNFVPPASTDGTYTTDVWYKLAIVANYTSGLANQYVFYTNGTLLASKTGNAWTPSATKRRLNIDTNFNVDNVRLWQNSTICPVESTSITNSSWNITSGNLGSGTGLEWNTGGTVNVTSDLLSYTVTASEATNMSCSLHDWNYSTMVANDSNYKSATTDVTSHAQTLYDSLAVGTQCVYCSFVRSDGTGELANSTSGCLNVERVSSCSSILENYINGTTTCGANCEVSTNGLNITIQSNNASTCYIEVK